MSASYREVIEESLVAGNTRIVMNQDGDVEVEALGAMTLKARRDLTLEGMNVKIKGQMNTDVEAGAQATVKATMEATLNGGLSATVQGATVSIKGITSESHPFLPDGTHFPKIS